MVLHDHLVDSGQQVMCCGTDLPAVVIYHGVAAGAATRGALQQDSQTYLIVMSMGHVCHQWRGGPASLFGVC